MQSNIVKKNKTIVKMVAITMVLAIGILLAPKVYKKFISPVFKEKIVWGTPNEEQDKTEGIPIVITIDDGYSFQALVTLTSLLKNANSNTFYKINVLTPPEFKDESKKIILSVQEKYKNNCLIEFISMNDCFSHSYVSTHFTETVYFRLRIPDIFKSRKKCIYIDTDIIVEKDLTELYDQDLKGNYIAGVADSIRAVKDEKEENQRKSYEKTYGIKSTKRCINSGVLVWDLQVCREENVTDKFRDFLESHENPAQHDQTTINAVCQDHIKSLPLKYNTQTYLNTGEKWGEDEENWSRIFSKEIWEEAWEKPVIVHFAGGEKPWKDPSTFWIEKWWDVARQTPYKKEIIKKFSAIRNQQN